MGEYSTLREVNEDDSGVIQPLYFIDEKKKKDTISPIYNIDDEIDGPERFVIARTTDNGKWVRNGILFYRLNGVTIFADIDDIILVDLNNQTMTVKRGKNVKEMVNPTNPEMRQYLLLLYLDDSNTTWESITGRSQAYDYIKNNIEDFDPDQSIVLTENVPYKDAYSITQFVKYIKNANLVEEDDFEIGSYSVEEINNAREQQKGNELF